MTTAPPAPKPNSKYSKLFGRTVAVNVDTSTRDEDDYRTIEGKVVEVSDVALAVKVRNKIEIIRFTKIIGDVEIQSPTTKSKVAIRKIKHPGLATRAHLAMRHGMSLPLMNAITEDVAIDTHDKIDHGPLGHRHVSDPDPVDEAADGDKRVRQRQVNDDGKPIRQHMADRHGQRVSVLEALSDANIRTLHDSINHDALGHRHDEPPKRRASKVAVTATVVTPRPVVEVEEFPLDLLV